MTGFVDAVRRLDAPVLVVLAHPDDEALLCGGTIAALTEAEVDVRVVSYSDGGQGRASAFCETCELLGAKGELLDLPACSIRVDDRLVSTTDELVRSLNPGCVITHSASGLQNQDHVALNHAVKLSIGRWPTPAIALAVEPPYSSADFHPNVFVDVTTQWGAKVDAVNRYRAILDRTYMTEGYLTTRASWWSQVAGIPGLLVEAFELMRWRP
jgi:LmbE family N-acetylglucosaminyl deacetylase